MTQRRMTGVLMALSTCGLISPVAQAELTPLKGYVMDIQMVPAICALDKQKSKKRKCVEGYSLNISGLYPEINRDNCQTRSSATLLPLQAKVVSRVMPDHVARAQLWAEYGGCVSLNASQYFRTIINYADRLNVPLELSAADNKATNISTLRAQFLKLNKTMKQQSLHFQCQVLQRQQVLTNIQICYTASGQYKNCPQDVATNCPHNFIIKGTF